ncbi:long-chain acyl-CoA synthetase [Sinobacterium caligoides]|uniref:Long-chain acyl-CoA synthetase n=1 Tax=Sinobacterium caligoides TaxID=933926 RepID=A0A3N2DZ93_9GAMM|nr:long-chain fatty acid--CoA ligase [Sinobacterium caligoides]ROS04779.1 long-chain acyl-CoA synthetase [Sinobacterium caligoides]
MLDHLVHIYRQKMLSDPNHIAQSEGDEHWTWQQIQQQVDAIAIALLETEVAIQENIGIFSDNCAQWTWIDLASQAIRAVPVPIYATSTEQQLAYVINDAQIRILFTGNKQQHQSALKIRSQCPSLEYIISIEDLEITDDEHSSTLNAFSTAHHEDIYHEALSARISSADLNDIITLIYTSGTTGEPKGVILDYQNIAAAIEMHQQRIIIDTNDVSLCFLPLSHIFERAWSWYALANGCRVAYCRNPARVMQALTRVKPTVMCAVPRLYEKIYTQIMSQADSASALKKIVFNLAYKIADARFNRQQNKKSPGFFLNIVHRLADKLVFNNIRQALGGNMRILPCGGAALDADINRFFQLSGLNIVSGFGMTETCATVCCRDEISMPLNSCGTALPGVELKLGKDNELLVKAPTVMRGYYNKPEATAATIIDGWLHTGDAAEIIDGCIIITERLKDLMKTSNGKYVAPQHVEGKLVKEQLIEQITIIGDDRQYVSALIVPAFEHLETLATQKGIEYKNRLDLIANSEVIQHFKERIDKVQKELANHEKIKKFTLLAEEFTIAKNELTPTFKVKRKIVLEKFKHEINAMYQNVKNKASRH